MYPSRVCLSVQFWKKNCEEITQLLYPTKNIARSKHPLEHMVKDQEKTGAFKNILLEFFQKLPCNSCTMWTRIILKGWRLAAINQAVCSWLTSLTYTSTSWWCISIGETFFAHKNWITQCGTQLDEHAIGSPVANSLDKKKIPKRKWWKHLIIKNIFLYLIIFPLQIEQIQFSHCLSGPRHRLLL